MSSRERILHRVKLNAPLLLEKGGHASISVSTYDHPVEKFKDSLSNIGANVHEIQSLEVISTFVSENFSSSIQCITFSLGIDHASNYALPQDFASVQVAVLKGSIGVAENGSIWINEKNMFDRALPFICEHLILAINKGAIVSTLHDAYEKIGSSEYDYSAFIAGPSKTADIEQSLVLGAHGAKTLNVFILDDETHNGS